MQKILFILKKRGLPYYQSEPNCLSVGSFSSGLHNSVKFVNQMLQRNDVISHMVEVNDNNDIDREVTNYMPDVVVIEALWVVPEKFEILQKLHPNVKWVVRIHSEVPFLSNEGVAMDWILKYVTYPNVYVGPNTQRMVEDLKNVLPEAYSNKIEYLPNYYIELPVHNKPFKVKGVINVGCFGAIRPLKNQLIQAMAAIDYARKYKTNLRFHINASRVEQGNNVLKNIRKLFENLNSDQFKLVEHGWLMHNDFVELVSTMDIGLQLSFSETFNIVASDFVSQEVPIVTSAEISWISSQCHANPTSSNDIVKTMKKVLNRERIVVSWNKVKLCKFNKVSEKVWLNYLKN